MRAIFKDPAHQSQFDDQGYVEVDLLNPAEVAALVELHDRESVGAPEMSSAFTAQSSDAALRRRVSDGITAVLQPHLDHILLGCRAVLGNFFHKQPSSAKSQFFLHQDWSYVDEVLHQSLTVWCPFQDVDEANGTLAVVPGSHLLSRRPRGFVTQFPYHAHQSVLRNRYSRQLTMRAGQAVLFHQRLFHWSGPNRTATRRLAANCFVAPTEAGLFLPHMDAEARPNEVEMFEADVALLTSFTVGQRPTGARSLGWRDATPEPVDAETLERVLGRHVGGHRPD